MQISRRALVGGATALAAAWSGGARAQGIGSQGPRIKIGVLADFSGIYTDLLGPGGVGCVQQAVADFGPEQHGFSVDVVFADHQNKPDVGSGIARRWYDSEGVDLVIGLPNSSVALALAFVTAERNKACIGTAVTSMEFTGAQCTPNTINWTYDAYMLAKALGTETVKSGGRKWYFITTDNAFGNAIQGETASFVQQAGGTVLGNSRYPIGATDYSSFLIAAQGSGAQVLGLALAGTDMVNCLKQADEFGLRDQMRIAAPVMFLNDINALGLPLTQGLLHTNSFYWDANDRTRAFTRRVLPRMQGAYPGMVHAGCYAGTLHYLKAVAALGVTAAKASGAAAIARMKEMPADDDAFGRTVVRQDGRALVPAFLLQVKKPAESKARWDYCKVVTEIPGDEAAKPLAQGGCPLVKA
ncbi:MULTISPECIES: ABC transporter substrate-binding protein [Methylobacterium]|uniref:ABC transporter substrate-binding protein n=1 Tax=Methylobacterium TaxID=407 RepID=UPI00272DD1E2|nr:ABC transporter substrate-binding protein [Methylobacterium sp.]